MVTSSHLYRLEGPIGPHLSRPTRARWYCQCCCLSLSIALTILLALCLLSLAILIYVLPCPVATPLPVLNGTHLTLPSPLYRWKCSWSSLYLVDDRNQTMGSGLAVAENCTAAEQV